MSQEPTKVASAEVRALSNDEIDTVTGAAMKFFWLAVYNGLWGAKCGSDPCLVYIKG
jgi:hypothetical protein